MHIFKNSFFFSLYPATTVVPANLPNMSSLFFFNPITARWEKSLIQSLSPILRYHKSSKNISLDAYGRFPKCMAVWIPAKRRSKLVALDMKGSQRTEVKTYEKSYMKLRRKNFYIYFPEMIPIVYYLPSRLQTGWYPGLFRWYPGCLQAPFSGVFRIWNYMLQIQEYIEFRKKKYKTLWEIFSV